MSGKLAHKAVKKAVGVGDRSVLTGPRIDLCQYKLSYTNKEKKGLKNRTLLCVWYMPEDTAVFYHSWPYALETGSH